MSAQYDRFVEALEALCREHRVQLSVSEYDTLNGQYSGTCQGNKRKSKTDLA